MEDRESVDGGRYDERSLMGEHHDFGGGSILEEGIVFLVWHIFWCWEFGFGGFCESLQGALGCWGFWARGPGFLTVSWS
jgi:hypothetical protein